MPPVVLFAAIAVPADRGPCAVCEKGKRKPTSKAGQFFDLTARGTTLRLCAPCRELCDGSRLLTQLAQGESIAPHAAAFAAAGGDSLQEALSVAYAHHVASRGSRG